MATDAYRECIREVFIEPIRSVLIVDDEYPTWSQLLAALTQADTPTYSRPLERVREMIAAFHRRQPPLLVDIYDGTDVTTDATNAASSRLHQTDFLVLDYELDAANRGDGSRAIGILRSLMANPQFNLVMVHTKEDLDDVFNEVRWGLLAASREPLLVADRERAERLVGEAEDDAAGFGARLRKTIESEQYFYARLNPDRYRGSAVQGLVPYVPFAQVCRPDWRPEDRLIVLRYLLADLERRHAGQMRTDTRSDDVRWSTGANRWVWSNSVFVGFCDKASAPDLLDSLQNALVDWCPHPSRLLLARLRIAVENYGILAQSPALTKRHALAYWYRELVRAPHPERHWRVRQTVSRHAAELVESVLDEVATFAVGFVDADAETGEAEEISRRHFGIDLENGAALRAARRQHNMVVCSMTRVGWHLTLGHVFRMADEHWLCLSAACDMVPSQLSPWRTAVLGESLPFLAVQLARIRANRNIDDVQTNRYVFLPERNEVAVFGFNVEPGASPQWHLLYAANRGRFSDDQFHFSVSRMEVESDALVARSHKAQVVAQLRYEYALSLAQKLGAVLTRVGLDFVAD